MANPRNQELESKLLRLFRDSKLKSKDDLLTLFCKHLGFEHAETKLPSRSAEYWGDGQTAQLVEKESFEILARTGDPRLGGFAVIYGTLRDFNLSNQRSIILQLRKTFPDALYVFAKAQTFGRERGAQIDIAHARLRAAIGVDGVDLVIPVPVGGKRDLHSVGGPIWVDILARAARETDLSSTVGLHRVDLVVAVAVRGERDLAVVAGKARLRGS